MDYKFAINEVVTHKGFDISCVVWGRTIHEGTPMYNIHWIDDKDETACMWAEENDLVSSQCFFDNHYKGDVQPIELMQAQMEPEAFMGFLRGNIIKYACRVGKKDDVAKETTKILRYAEWLDKVAKGEKVNPRV